MSTRTIWTILIRLSALWMIIDFFYLIPQSATPAFLDPSTETIFIALLVIAFFIAFIRFVLFKADWIIDNLKLTKNIEQETLQGNLEKSTIYHFGILVLGGLILIDGISCLISQIVMYINANRFVEQYNYESTFFTFDLVFYVVKSIIGYLLITNVNRVIQYIESKNQQEKQ